MSEKTLKFEITTPKKTVLTDKILQLSVPTKQGEITILPDHIPVIASLAPGVLEVKNKNGETEIIAVSGGFVEVMPGRVIILSDLAEKAPEIDMEKAKEAKRKAEEEKHSKTQIDKERFVAINAQISKEFARTQAVQKWKKLHPGQ